MNIFKKERCNGALFFVRKSAIAVLYNHGAIKKQKFYFLMKIGIICAAARDSTFVINKQIVFIKCLYIIDN